MNNDLLNPSIAKEYLLLLMVAAIWGTSFGLIKVGVSEIGPFSLTAGRILIAALALSLWTAMNQSVKLDLSRPALLSYMVVGLFGNALPFALIGWSSQTLDSSMVAILMGIMPLFTLAMAHFFLEDEPFSARAIMGISLGFSGLLVLLGFSVWEESMAVVIAQSVVMVATLSYAGVTVYVRRYVTKSGIEMATGAMISASLFSITAAFVFENPSQMSWTPRAVVPMAMLGLFPTALASVLYFRLVRNLGATRFAQINYIIPVFGSIIGATFLDEQISLRMWAALILVLSGIFLVHGARRGTPRML